MAIEPSFAQSQQIDALPVPNLPLLRKVLDHIDAHPEEWRQMSWAVQNGQGCGTAFCIAGHAAVLTGAEPVWKEDYDESYYACKVVLPDGSVREIADYAQEQLGLTGAEASDWGGGLFAGDNSRADVQRIAERIAARAGERL